MYKATLSPVASGNPEVENTVSVSSCEDAPIFRQGDFGFRWIFLMLLIAVATYISCVHEEQAITQQATTFMAMRK